MKNIMNKFIFAALIAIGLSAIITPCNAASLFDWNSLGDSGTTWNGWTYYSNGANDYGSPGWRDNKGQWYSGDSNWKPRIHEKNDYGNDSLATIDATNRAPSTLKGGSLKVYDTGNSSINQASWWYLFGKNFGTTGLADSTTNRMDFYFKTSGMTSNSGLTTDPENANIHVGTYLCWPGGGLGGEDCPTEASNQHYYHYLTINEGTWLHVLLDRHPTHQRGAVGAEKPNDNPSPYNYFSVMDGFYIEIRYPQPSQTVYWIDEINLYTELQPENDISISSVWVGYWPGTDKWEIGFNDNSFNATGYNGSSQSTFEVRYSTALITNANYASAAIAEPEYWERGTTNTFTRGNVWKKPVWTRFIIPDAIESANAIIYFAIKDVSATANGDGHNAPSSLVKTIDYSLSSSAQPPNEIRPAQNLRLTNN